MMALAQFSREDIRFLFSKFQYLTLHTRRIIGCRRQHGINEPVAHDEGSFIGDHAQVEGDILALKYPVERGYVKDWDAMETIWHHAFNNQLQVSTSQHALLLTETPLNPKASREKATQIMFESFNVPALHIALQPTLCLYDTRFNTSVVLDSGDGVTHATAFYQGSPLIHSIIRLDFAGGDLTELLSNNLSNHGHSSKSITQEYAQAMKHKVCYVSQSSEVCNRTDTQTDGYMYKLPDGQEISLGDERFMIPETLFRPEVAGVQSIGMHEMIRNCVLKCDPDLQHNLYRKVVVVGGTTLLPGFIDRLRKELDTTAPSGTSIKVNAQPERQYSTWVGGSILASLSTFQGLWCSRQEYEEVGPVIIHRRFI